MNLEIKEEEKAFRLMSKFSNDFFVQGDWMPDAGCWMLDAGCWILDKMHSIRSRNFILEPIQ